MRVANENLKDLFAQARTIHLAYQHNAISRKEAILRSKPILRCLNATIVTIAKKHKMKPKYITFHNLGENL